MAQALAARKMQVSNFRRTPKLWLTQVKKKNRMPVSGHPVFLFL
jgi:hypothetical protein